MDAHVDAALAARPRKPFYQHLYVQVITAIVIGALLGHFQPTMGEAMKPLSNLFFARTSSVRPGLITVVVPS